jgi:carbon-monoxide dehydrogenase large subunit
MTFWHSGELGAVARDVDQLIRGKGLYVRDVHVDGETHGYVLRSPHAHARIRSIDTGDANKMPGVLAILTGADIAKIAQPLGCVMALSSRDGTPRAEADRPVLATDRARHAGEGVAFVVAEDLRSAQDAAERIIVEYEQLPPFVDPRDKPPALAIWPDVPGNVCFDWSFGDADACRSLFREAAHIVRMSIRNPRVAPGALEARSAIGLYDSQSQNLTLIADTQGVHFVRRVLAKALDLPQEKLRVVTPNVGGGFGSKIFAYPEQALVLCAARIVGRPVRWESTRSEAFLSDTQARDHWTEAALALDSAGRFLALSVNITANLGSALSQYTPFTATGVGAVVQAGAYRFQALEIGVRGMLTNTVPVDAYRGAGRPEAIYVLERLIDRAARDLGIDSAELRARNMPDTCSESMTSVTGLVIDGGRFLHNQLRCLTEADRNGFALRKSESAARGMLRGFGFANYLESNGGLGVARMIEPDKLPIEGAAVRFGADGFLEITLGTQSGGQDHASPMIIHAAESLGLAPERIAVTQGDTQALGRGGGTGGSKSLLTSSVAIEQAVRDVIARGRVLLARDWAASPEDIAFEKGLFSLTGTNRSASVAELAAAFPGELDGESRALLNRGSFANGCHACEVEIDPGTGEVHIASYTAVDDFGRVVNHAAVRGQVQGGIAQGIGQALMEYAAYDGISGQLAVGSWMDYAIPRAIGMPSVHWVDNGLPSQTNLFGAKACGEAGASAAPPTVMNAIVDALSEFRGGLDIQMPARAMDVWQIISGGKSAPRSQPG